MKKKKTQDDLGASEFAATLNGDNPQAILRVLKKFSKIVRRERRLALSTIGDGQQNNFDADDVEHEEDDEESSDDESEMTGPPPNKKYKKSEVWKEDTEEYQVPFVGTSIASGAETAQIIVKGEWPTGLLKSYLEKSPLAMELLNEDMISPDGRIHKGLVRGKKANLSRSIFKSYLIALSELLSADIVENNRRRQKKSDELIIDDAQQKGQQPFVPIFVSKFTTMIFKVLDDETDKGKGKPGIFGACGSWAAPALKVLQRLSMISVTHSRLVARYLEEELSDGVLRILLRAGPLHQRPIHAESENTVIQTKTCRVEAIRLAIALLQSGDSAVSSYICTGGSRERKVKPGLLYMALREGMAQPTHASKTFYTPDETQYYDGEHMEAVAEMLRAIRRTLTDPYNAGYKHLIGELLCGDALGHICRYVSLAPATQSGISCEDILAGIDKYNNKMKSFQRAGVEARRLVFLLFSDPSRSPLLLKISREIQHRKLADQATTKAMINLLGAPTGGVLIRQFLVGCVNKTPMLLPSLFAILPFPDPRNVYDFIASVSLVAQLQNQGPAAISSLPSVEQGMQNDDVLLSVVPVKYQRNQIGRALQSANSLVVFQCLRILKSSLERFDSLRSELCRANRWNHSRLGCLTTAFSNWMPDIQLLLALRSKFNARIHQKAHVLIHDCIFRIFETLSAVLPSMLNETKLNWMKILPEKNQFIKSPILAQEHILKTLLLTINATESTFARNSLQMKAVLEILLHTRNGNVYKLCRSVTRKSLLKILSSAMEEANTTCANNEISCWMDALSDEYVEGFCRIVQIVSTNLLGFLSNLNAGVVESIFDSNVEFSIYLVAALRVDDETIATFVSKVATQCLLRQRNPVPLATLVLHFTGVGAFSCVRLGSSLVEYSKKLLQFGRDTSFLRQEKLRDMLLECFDANSKWSRSCQLVCGHSGTIESIKSPSKLEDTISFTRFLVHMSLIANQSASKSLHVLARTVPLLMLHDRRSQETSYLLEDILRITSRGDSRLYRVLDQMMMSCPKSAKQNAIESKQDEYAKSISSDGLDKNRMIENSQRIRLLGLFLAENNLSAECIIKTKIDLLQCVPAEESNDPLSQFAFWWVLNFARNAPQLIDSGSHFNTGVLQQLVRCWWKVSDSQNDFAGDENTRIQVSSHLGSLLAQVLTVDGLYPVVVAASIGDYGAERFMDLILSLVLKENVNTINNDCGNLLLLQRVLEIRPVPYEKVFLNRNLIQPAQSLHQSFEGGLLDEIILMLLRKHSGGVNEEIHVLYTSLVKKIVSRTCNALSRVIAKNGEPSSVRKDLEMLRETMGCVPIPDYGEEIWEKLVATCNRDSRHFRIDPSIQSFVSIGMHLLQSNVNKNGYTDKPLVGELSSRLFVILCNLLPQSYKHCNSQHFDFMPQTVTAWLHSLVENAKDFGIQFPSNADKSILQKACRSCLKFGVSSSSASGPTAPGPSLRLVRTILVSHYLKQHFLVPSAVEVFNMVTSHSNFTLVLESNDPRTENSANIEMLNLLRCCLELDGNNISVPETFWMNANSSFSAGLGAVDTAVRLLLQSFCASHGEGVQIPFLHQLRWQGCPGMASAKDFNWDWLVSGLDSARIRCTVSHFPLFDAVRLDPRHYMTIDIGGVEVTADPGQISLDKEGDETSDGDDDEDGDGDDDGEEEDEDGKGEVSVVLEVQQQLENTRYHHLPTNHGLSPGIRWNKETEDIRYSPGFLLPLILGAVEDCMLSDHDDNLKSDSMQLTPFSDEAATPRERSNRTFIPTVHRLCEKGVVSFCLSSLSSHCVDIRQHAIAILGIFLVALESDEAKKRSSWRDRPQLAMLLNSVQRAYALKRARELDRRASVPMLSPLVAIFLARASISISRPDDTLFPALNHYFLKSDIEHGAFQDMNRLPGFMSLLCSSAEDSSVGRKERMWALQMLREGFIHPSCYRLVSACHAPELVLTSFENVRLGKSSDEMKAQEFTLLLAVLKKIIDYGSCTAVRHLVKLVGVLSWMRSQCVSRHLAKTFPTIATRRAFCDLVSSAIKAASLDEHLRKDILLQEAGILSQSILDIYLITVSDPRAPLEDSALEHSCCLALSELGCAHSLARNKSFHEKTHCQGFSVSSGAQFLKTVSGNWQQTMAVNSLSVLPVNFESFDSMDGEGFCSLLLLHGLSSSMTEPTIASVLARVSLVGQELQDCQDSDSRSILRTLLLSHSRLLKSSRIYTLWLECIHVFSCQTRVSTESALAHQLLKERGD